MLLQCAEQRWDPDSYDCSVLLGSEKTGTWTSRLTMNEAARYDEPIDEHDFG